MFKSALDSRPFYFHNSTMPDDKHLYALPDRHVWIQVDSTTGTGVVIKGPVANIEHEMHATFYRACPDGCLEPMVVTGLGGIYLGTELIRTGDLFDYFFTEQKISLANVTQ